MPGDRCLETHKMAEVDGPEQGTVVLDGIVQVVAGGVDPRQVLGVDKAQDMVHDLEGQLCKEDHCNVWQLVRHSRAPAPLAERVVSRRADCQAGVKCM